MLVRQKSKLNEILTKSFTELSLSGQVLFLYLLVTEKDHDACDSFLLQEDRTIDDLMRIRDALNEFEIGNGFKDRLRDLRVAISAFIFSKTPEPMEQMPPVFAPPVSAPPVSAPIFVPASRAPLFHSDPVISTEDDEFRPVPVAFEHNNKSRGRRAPHRRPAPAQRENHSHQIDQIELLLQRPYFDLPQTKRREFIEALLNKVKDDNWQTILQSQIAYGIQNFKVLVDDTKRTQGTHPRIHFFIEESAVCATMVKSQHEMSGNHGSAPQRKPSPVKPSMFPPVPQQEPVDVKQLWIDKLHQYRQMIDGQLSGNPERAFMEISMVQLLIRVLQNAAEPESLTGHPNYREVFSGEQLKLIAHDALHFVENKCVERAMSGFNPGK